MTIFMFCSGERWQQAPCIQVPRVRTKIEDRRCTSMILNMRHIT